ncbi:hypothetical protein H4F98_11430, partial [Lysobacter spongiae]|nr:hypothetical protein [Lysobacter spongiae]
MALIRANRESIDDRFSVLGFTVRTDLPLFEIGLATDPELLKAENRSHRTTRNFFSTRLLAAGGDGRTAPGGREAVYLVPPAVVARFVGQPRLYFGVATYQDKDRNRPISVKAPDAGHMYVSLSGLTERGLRRTLGANGQGGNGHALVWGGDALAPATNGAGGRNGATNGNGHSNGNADTHAAAPYSDGYSDDLWEQGAGGAAPAPEAGAARPNGHASPATDGASPATGPDAGAGAPPATAQAWR